MAGAIRGRRRLLIVVLLGLAWPPLPTCMAAERPHDVLYYNKALLPWKPPLAWGPYKLKLQPNCNLVLYDGKKNIWASHTAEDNCFGCVLRPDGRVVVYKDPGDAVFSRPRTGGPEGKYVLVLQDNRNVALYGPDIWAMTDATQPPPAQPSEVGRANRARTAAPPPSLELDGSSSTIPWWKDRHIIYSHRPGRNYFDFLAPLRWGPYMLAVEICDVKLYNGVDVVWRTDLNIIFNANCTCELKNDGNLVLYLNENERWRRIVWESETKGPKGKYALVLQNDGKVVIYGTQRWATGTFIPDKDGIVEINGTATNPLVGLGGRRESLDA